MEPAGLREGDRAALIGYAGQFGAPAAELAEQLVLDVEASEVARLRQSSIEASTPPAAGNIAITASMVAGIRSKAAHQPTLPAAQVSGDDEGREARSLSEKISDLPPRQREVVWLKFSLHFDYDTISKVTGLSLRNVGVLLHTALYHLGGNEGDAPHDTDVTDYALGEMNEMAAEVFGERLSGDSFQREAVVALEELEEALRSALPQAVIADVAAPAQRRAGGWFVRWPWWIWVLAGVLALSAWGVWKFVSASDAVAPAKPLGSNPTKEASGLAGETTDAQLQVGMRSDLPGSTVTGIPPAGGGSQAAAAAPSPTISAHSPAFGPNDSPPTFSPTAGPTSAGQSIQDVWHGGGGVPSSASGSGGGDAGGGVGLPAGNAGPGGGPGSKAASPDGPSQKSFGDSNKPNPKGGARAASTVTAAVAAAADNRVKSDPAHHIFAQLPGPDPKSPAALLQHFTPAFSALSASAQPTQKSSVSIKIEATESPWAPDHPLLMVTLYAGKGDAVREGRLTVILLLDRSNSMAAPNRLPLAKDSIRQLIAGLQPTDRVGIVTYSGSAANLIEPTVVAESEQVLAALNAITPSGGTDGSSGLRAAYAMARATALPGHTTHVVLLSDGDFNMGTTDPVQLNKMVSQEAAQGFALSVLGFGRGHRVDPRLADLAGHGRGGYGSANSPLEARRIITKVINGWMQPLIHDVRLAVTFDPTVVAGVRLVASNGAIPAHREHYGTRTLESDAMADGDTLVGIFEVTPSPGRAFMRVSGITGVGLSLHYLKSPEKSTEPAISVENQTTPTPRIPFVSLPEASPDLIFAASLAHLGQALNQSPVNRDDLEDVISFAELLKPKNRGFSRGGYVEELQAIAEECRRELSILDTKK